MIDPIDSQYMRQAIDLAMRGRGAVEPNPMVGCVIVKDGRVIGRGYHQKFGEAHAEPNALMACAESPAGATVYVTLEPCCHTKKKTPPCAPRLIEAKVGRVVIGCVDPHPLVSGGGIDMLRKAGIEVIAGVMEAQCLQLIAPFMARCREERPYVTLKWAQSADGKIAGPGGARAQISNPASSRAVHELRGRCDAIMVALRTVLADDPMLTVRGATAMRTPMRIVLDRDLRLPLESKLAASARQTPVWVFCSEHALHQRAQARRALEDCGIQIYEVPANDAGRLSLSHVLRLLRNDVTHLLVEPGRALAESFIASGLADRAWVIRSPKVIADDSAPSAAAMPWDAVAETELDEDRLSEHLNPRSPVYFAAESSADFAMVKR